MRTFKGHRQVSGPRTLSPQSLRQAQGRLSVLSPCSAMRGCAFSSRAHRWRRSDFELDAGNAAAVVEICQRLDGLPLAIELAAARVWLLSPQVLVSRLGNRLSLLTGGAHDLPTRQQTLRATLDWSMNMLDERERRLLARLAVFPHNFTLEAAETVCGADGEVEALDGISSLLDNSLLRQGGVTGSRDGASPRYWMLETIREYALARLAESGEMDSLRRRHAEHYRALAETAHAGLLGQRQAEWLRRLDLDHDNLRAALAWSLEAGEVDTKLRICSALWIFWSVNGHLSEGRRWLEEALGASTGTDSPARAMALVGAGHMAWKQADFGAAKAWLAEGPALHRTLGDLPNAATALQNLGAVALDQGEHRLARGYFEESLALHRELRSKQGISYAVRELGLLKLWSRDLEEARMLTQEALELQREMGDEQAVAGLLSRLGLLAMVAGDLERATALQRESLLLTQSLGARSLEPVPLAALGTIAWTQGEHERATELYNQSLTMYQALGARHSVAWLSTSLAVVALEEGSLERATALAAEALELFRALSAAEGIAECLEVLAAVAVAEGQAARGVGIFAAVGAVREALGVTAPPFDRPAYDPWVLAARRELGEDAFAAAWGDGSTMTVEQAAELALNERAASVL